MSGPQAKPFKARLGLDANNEKVINVKDPSVLTDAVNLQYFIATNTVQPFDANRTYPAGFVVERGDRLYKAKALLNAGAWNGDLWTEIHAFDLWQRISGNYNAEPGDALIVNTQSASVTITLPVQAEEGDAFTIVDDGFAATNPIILNGQTATFNGGPATTYSINSSDTLMVVYLGGTWRVNRLVKETYQYIQTSVTVAPNSWNNVSTAAARTITLPIAPIGGQWVVVADGTNNARTNNITIQGNGKNINGATAYVIRRLSEVVTLIYDAVSGEWKAQSDKFATSRIIESTVPLVSEQVFVTLDGTTKTMTLPTTSLQNGDWVEVITKYQDETAAGSLVVSAGGSNYFRLNGGTQNTTTYRIRNRGRYLFLYKSSEWTVIAQPDTVAVPNLSSGSMIANSTVNLVGQASQTITLPQSDQVRIGDTVTAFINSASASVVISVQNTSTDLLDAATTATYTVSDNGLPLVFVYRGWNGTKYVWETIVVGSSYLKKTQNLADVPDKAAARTNLSVYSKAEADANYLPLHGKADTAGQADNANTLDNLDSTDFIQVRNPSTTAVDANTTTETRFTTSVNTPDATVWQVVTFIDKTSGDKSQIAMSKTTNKIAYRVYTSSAWSAWSYLDQAANAATATKLATARNIALSADASGSVSFDGSANVSIPVTNVQASKLKSISTTPSAPASLYYSKIGTYTLPAQYDGYVGKFKILNNKSTGTSTPLIGMLRDTEVYLRLYQASAIGSNPYIVMNVYGPIGIGYVIVQNTPSVVVDIYIQSSAVNAVYSTAEIQGILSGTATASVPATSGAWSATVPSGYVAATATNPYDDSYHPLADKWTTTRTITLTGSGVSGSTTIDGSGDITIPLTVDSSGIGAIPISQVTGLQSALDNKLGLTAKAADSDKLDGLDSTAFRLVSAPTQASVDPNTVTTDIVLTNHANTPNGGTTYWYIDTTFYQTASTSSNRFQFAYQYNGGQTVYFRQYYGSWSAWTAVAALIDGNTYNINISGNAATATNATNATAATTATKLATARTINGVAFDGTANITVQANPISNNIASSTDLNTLLTPGNYTCPASATAATLTNCPTNIAFGMVVYATSGVCQELREYSTVKNGGQRKWFRSYYSGTWGAWYQMFDAGTDLPGFTATGQIIGTNADNFRIVSGNYGAFWRNDGTTYYLMLTDSGNQYGNWNSFRPFQVGVANGYVTMGAQGVTIQGGCTFNSAISVAGTSTFTGAATFNGSAYNNNWWRSTGSTGWYNQDFGGGIMMQDTTWVRIFGSKAFLVSNDIAATGNVTAYYSDKRLKENLKVIENALDTVKSWTGYHYNANVLAQSYGYDPNKKEIGLLAQDVQATTPEAVEQAPFDVSAVKGKSLSGQNYLTLKYERLVPVLVQAIKEMDEAVTKKFQEQENRIAALEAAIEKLLKSE